MTEENNAGNSGQDEPAWADEPPYITGDGDIAWRSLGTVPTPPLYYYPDGKPIVDDELLPATLKWAMLLEQRDEERIVGQCKTLYGERLSTVWLGLNHNWGTQGPPILFETMLFAPDTENVRRRTLPCLFDEVRGVLDIDYEAKAEREAFEAYTAKHYPDDGMQLRYATREEAEESFYKLRLQCLIPPRWRHFLCWTIGQDPAWRRWDEGDDE